MADAPRNIAQPELHPKWSKAKKKAEKQAQAVDKAAKDSKKTQQNAYKKLARTFKDDLGPNLDRWVKLYPDYVAMERLRKTEINAAIKRYLAAVGKADLDDSVSGPLEEQLSDIKSIMKKRSELAKRAIESDVSLAVADSLKKVGSPIQVFKHNDIGALVRKKYAAKNVELTGKLAIEVIISDSEILAKFPNDGKDRSNHAAKIKEAGDFSTLVGDIAAAYEKADKAFTGGSSLAREEGNFRKAIGDAIDDAVERSTKEAARLAGLRAKSRWANVKRGGKLTLTMAGAAASVAALGATPFTAGASTIIGIVALANASASIGRQVADIASTAEMMANGIAKDLNTLKRQYGKWVAEAKSKGGTSDKVGGAEMGKRAVNALVPAMLTTLKSVKGDVGTYSDKINNLEVKADRLADNLDEWLTDQKKAEGIYRGIESKGFDALDDKEVRNLKKIFSEMAKIQKAVAKLIDSVGSLNGRVAKNRRLHTKLSKELSQISNSNPTWSEVGSALFEVSAGVAFLVGGNVNAPDPYKFAETAAKIGTAVGAASSSIEVLEGVAEDLRDSFEARKKKVRK